MKKKKTSVRIKVLRVFLVLSCSILLGALIFFFKGDSRIHSFKNSGYFGCSLYYDALQKLEYQVNYSIVPIKYMETDTFIVLNVGSNEKLEGKTGDIIHDFVHNGGQILILASGSSQRAIENSAEAIGGQKVDKDDQLLEKWGFPLGGVMLTGNIEYFRNLEVTMEREKGYQLLQELHPYITGKKIVFNEYYLYNFKGQPTLWQVIPSWLKYGLLQSLILILVFFWYKGKRFGEPSVNYNESEAEEHSYALAVAEVTYQAKHFESLVERYYHYLCKKIEQSKISFMDDREKLSDYFVNNGKQHYYSAQSVDNFMDIYYKNKKNLQWKEANRTEMRKMIISMQELEQVKDTEKLSLLKD